MAEMLLMVEADRGDPAYGRTFDDIGGVEPAAQADFKDHRIGGLAREGEEVVELYLTDEAATVPVAVRSLQGVVRVSLKPGERRRVAFTLSPRQLSLIDGRGRRVVEPGVFTVSVGGKQPGFKGTADAQTTGVALGRFVATGRTAELPDR